MTDIHDTADLVSKALRRAWQLGQTYWQQADSEYQSHWKKADATQATFDQLVEDTRAAILTSNSGAQPAPSFADAYQGAMEEVAIWKKRALEAEDLNRKFVAEINGPTYMGEPAQPAPSVPDTYAAGINAVAAMLQSKADEYAKEHGHDDMGGLSFGPGMGGEIKMDYYTNLIELVDDARAMLAEMEKQEPVAWMLNCPTLGGDTGWILSWTQSGAGLCNRLQGEENEKRLYAIPGAQAQPAPDRKD